MRVLFLIPGGSATQLQAIPAVAATAERLAASVQVACPPAAAAVWKLLPAVEKVLPFSFGAGVSLAEWANLLGAVREPDFQVCLNLASGWPLDLLLSLTHIPTRIARSGFSATTQLAPGGSPAAPSGWPNQALEAWLQPIEVPLEAAAFRLRLAKSELEAAAAALPPGPGPLLLLAPNPATAEATPATTGTATDDWPAAHWQALPEQIRLKLPDLRVCGPAAGSPAQQAARVAAADVVLSSDPLLTELALLTGTPLVALGRSGDSLPARQGVQGVGEAGSLDQLGVAEVLKALGLG